MRDRIEAGVMNKSAAERIAAGSGGCREKR